MSSDERLTILTIEDEEVVRDFFAHYLNKRGYNVIKATSGKEGIELFRKEYPDIVLLDLALPEMNGHQVLSLLSEYSNDVPVIIVSGIADFDNAIKAMRLGAWDFLTKPITDMRILEHTISKALDRRNLLNENREHKEHLEEMVAKRTKELEKELVLRRKTESRLKDSLQEKELLLREIHHRVKNNLQVISSLLNLQTEQIVDPQVTELFQESRNRIKSIALVHEKIYQSRDLAKVDFSEYLQNFTGYLCNTYGSQLAGIELIREIAVGVHFSIDIAIPCGLIVNELISNALKHAFTNRHDEEKKIIKIALKTYPESSSRSADNKVMSTAYLLIISDNGIGIVNDFESQKTLGLRLVNTLVDQIGGSMENITNGGTEFRIKFEYTDN